MSHPSGKEHWMHRDKLKHSEFYKSVGAVCAMLTDFSPENLESIVDWGQHVLETKPLWYRQKFRRVKP